MGPGTAPEAPPLNQTFQCWALHVSPCSLVDLIRWAGRQRITDVREASPVSASLDFIRTSPTLESLKLVCVAIERMRRAPIYDHLPIKVRANRPLVCAKPNLHKNKMEAPDGRLPHTVLSAILLS
jgi:hypothetical protein